MPPLVVQALIRLAVTLPAMLVAAALLWYALKTAGVMKTGAPFTRSDMRTWPLRYALADAALFAAVFSIAMACLGDGDGSAAIAAAISAAAAIGLGPYLAALTPL
jgi:hypothetical protein